jgi:hypothetical protein
MCLNSFQLYLNLHIFKWKILVGHIIRTVHVIDSKAHRPESFPLAHDKR